MTALALISGALSRAPEQRMSKAGKAYCTATIKVAAGSEIEFWSIMGFSETVQAELMRLGEGDKLSLQGSLKLEVYTSRDGERKISRTLFADHVLVLRQPPRERKPSNAAAKRDTASAPARADFDDGLPEQWGDR